ncbi:glia maturation factor beta [Cutaneotrichosporon oleaginosum]|uniref:Glia maturation factor beta n=1 Tax=Cutaneotrichosporon oleaginosum TaxID=879819 RepID=A0A0J0XEJ2_9TREE|nr:glia maturation factor beta [Cutaneotrichosporon oleaginosum]KLT39482.1 glia maturation factor beta [Cutaneotrichosporon oleaginosum]
MSRTVQIPTDVQDALKKFRFTHSKGNAAISIKIVKASLTMAVDEEFVDVSVEEIAEELPENSPRLVLLSHELKHKDGRVSYPLLLINWMPSTAPTDLMTLQASSLSYFQQTAEVAKILEVRDGEEGLTTDAVNDKLLQT